MRKRFSWLEEPIPDKNLYVLLVGALSLHLLLSLGGVALIQMLGMEVNRNGAGETPINWAIIPFMFLVGVIEEFLFRFLPLSIPLKIGSRPAIVAVAIVSSAIFGWLHGGPMNLFVQGVSGLLYSVVFIKCSDFGKRLWRGYACSITLHIVFNLFLVAILLLCGENTF